MCFLENGVNTKELDTVQIFIFLGLNNILAQVPKSKTKNKLLLNWFKRDSSISVAFW